MFCTPFLLLLLLPSATPFRYSFTTSSSSSSSQDDYQYLQVLSEGPMYASSSITLGGTALASNASLQYRISSRVLLHIFAVDAVSQAALGMSGSRLPVQVPPYCCTQAIYASGGCASVGQLILDPTEDGVTIPMDVYTLVAGNGAVPLNSSFKLSRTGWAALVLLACPADLNEDAAVPTLTLALRLAFSNPYGYLPGIMVGAAWQAAALAAVYFTLAVAYTVALARHAKHVLRMQYLVLACIVTACVESVVWTAVWFGKNTSGIPTPCTVCGVSSDYVFAVSLSVLRRAVSRVLLLALSLGFGVVSPTLSRNHTLACAALGIAYAVSACVDALVRVSVYTSSLTPASIAALAFTLAFLIYTYVAITYTRESLKAAGQSAKRAMYDRLFRVCVGAGVAACLAAVLLELAESGALPIPWQSLFLLINFEDICYAAVIASIAWIWRPGPEAYQYAWYAQALDGDAPAMDDIDGDVELAAAPNAASSTSMPEHPFTIGDAQDVEDDVRSPAPVQAASTSVTGPLRSAAKRKFEPTPRRGTPASPEPASPAVVPVTQDAFEPDFDAAAAPQHQPAVKAPP